ncbi:MAG: PD40 domain-containing protein, partial [Anaerolineales bacterium]|nr:PD40 domain-containing protein [Anaerolineales bacterium]
VGCGTTPEPQVEIELTAVVAQLPTVVPTAQLPTDTAVAPETTATVTMTPFPTLTPVPPPNTATPEPTPRPWVTLDPVLPPPTGQIFMAWDSDPLPYENMSGIDFHHNFYRFDSISPPAFHKIDTTSIEPAMISFLKPKHISPNQQKMALPIYIDTNGNGRIDPVGYDADKRIVHIYDINNNTFTPIGSKDYLVSSVSWLPDSQGLLYRQGQEIVLTHLASLASETILHIPDSQLGSILLSPDGETLVVEDSRKGQLTVYDYLTNQVIAAPAIDDVSYIDYPAWSFDSLWLAFKQSSSPTSLALYSRDTNQFTRLPATDEDKFGAPFWSPDDQWLAFTRNKTTLSLWNRETLATTDVLTATYISAPLWSDDQQLVVGTVTDSGGQLVVLDLDTGTQQIWPLDHGYEIKEMRLLSWSPDGNWLAFMTMGQEGTGSGVYLAPRQGGETYLLLDMFGYETVSQFEWVSSLP